MPINFVTALLDYYPYSKLYAAVFVLLIAFN